MSGIASDLMKLVVVDLIAEEEDELMRTAELSAAADIQGVDIGENAQSSHVEKEEPGSSGATIPDPLTQVKEEADGLLLHPCNAPSQAEAF